MAYILNIETATTNCSVSLSKDGETVSFREDYDSKYSHAERLHDYIKQVVTQYGISLQDIDAVAVGKGPGSYTGLRIGVSAAKGLCHALDVPLIAINTLEALALQVKTNSGFIIPLLDARRMEVYTAVFDTSYDMLSPVRAEILDENAFTEYLAQNQTTFIGNGVEKAEGIISHENAIFLKGKLPSANYMSLLSYKKFKDQQFEDVAYFEPYYLKDFIALKPKGPQLWR